MDNIDFEPGDLVRLRDGNAYPRLPENRYRVIDVRDIRDETLVTVIPVLPSDLLWRRYDLRFFATSLERLSDLEQLALSGAPCP